MILELPPKQWPASMSRVRLSKFASRAVGHLAAGKFQLVKSTDKSGMWASYKFEEALRSTSNMVTEGSSLKQFASMHPPVPPTQGDN